MYALNYLTLLAVQNRHWASGGNPACDSQAIEGIAWPTMFGHELPMTLVMGVSDVFIYWGWYRRIALYQIPPLLNKESC